MNKTAFLGVRWVTMNDSGAIGRREGGEAEAFRHPIALDVDRVLESIRLLERSGEGP